MRQGRNYKNNNQETNVKLRDKSANYAKKFNEIGEQLMARLAEEQDGVPTFRELMTSERLRRRENAKKQLAAQSSKGLAGLKNMTMFASKAKKKDLKEFQSLNENKIAAIPSVKIPDFKPKKFNMNGFRLNSPTKARKKKKKFYLTQSKQNRKKKSASTK